jgi:hypothetical protein
MKKKKIMKIQRRMFNHKKELAMSHDVLANLIKDVRVTMKNLDAATKEINSVMKRLDKASKLN